MSDARTLLALGLSLSVLLFILVGAGDFFYQINCPTEYKGLLDSETGNLFPTLKPITAKNSISILGLINIRNPIDILYNFAIVPVNIGVGLYNYGSAMFIIISSEHCSSIPSFLYIGILLPMILTFILLIIKYIPLPFLNKG